MLSKKDNTGSIQRSRLPKNCKRLWTRVMRLWTWAMAVGFQPIREFPGISRCWDVEDQRSLVLCAGGSIWHFWRRQMQLLQQKLRLNGVEISDLWVLCFGSLYWFLVQSFTPSLIHKSFFTSQRYILHTKDDIKTNNHRRKQWTVTEFECFFHNLPNKKPKSWSKSHGSPIFGPFFGYHFFNGFFLSAWEPPGSDARGKPRKPRGHANIHMAARDGDVPALRHFLRVTPERVHKKDWDGRWPQRMAELRLRWCCGWKVPEEIQYSQVWCWQKSWLFNVGVCLDLNFQTTNDY